LFERHDDNLRQKYRGRALSGGELGCFASHFLLWQRCVELNEPIVVMEDDVTIDESFNEALGLAESNIDRLRYLRLAGTYLKRRPYKKIGVLGSFDLIDHIKGPAGTLCYVISPKAATIFVQNADVWFLAVDDYMDWYWHHHINCYSLMPFPVGIGEGCSDIVRIPKTSQPLWKKLRKEIYVVIEGIRRRRYNFKKVRSSPYEKF
jgi:glycosyl transferase family 25